jgi:diguanylate cyclase (GGDEF)-like protein
VRVDILKYLQLQIGPMVYRQTKTARASRAKDGAGPFSKMSDKGPATVTAELNDPGIPPPSHHEKSRTKAATGNIDLRIKPGNVGKRYSLRRFLLVLTLSIFFGVLLKKFLFISFPKLHSIGIPLICSVILIILLSPALYTFVYRPMIMQFDKLKKVAGKLRKFALMDDLTGLYNRRGFLIHSDHLLRLSNRTKRGLILIYADLDHLKWINDDFGHAEGDRALVSIASMLKGTFRNSDVVARFGGDEFVILALEAKAESRDALRKRLNENLNRVRYIDSKFKLTFSLGIIYYNPEKPLTIEELLRTADQLMYKEKTFRTIVSPALHPVGT